LHGSAGLSIDDAQGLPRLRFVFLHHEGTDLGAQRREAGLPSSGG